MKMDLDEFKATWKSYDQKLDSAERSAQHILAIVRRNRSRSTLDKMSRELRLPTVILLVLVFFFSAVIVGNAFDYTRPIHYVPAFCYVFVAATGFYLLVRHSTDLRRTALHTHNLHQSLMSLIQLRIRHSTLMKWVWILVMLAGSMVTTLMIARKFANSGWLYTLLIFVLPIGITAISVGLASLAGMFTDPYLADLRNQVDELDEIP